MTLRRPVTAALQASCAALVSLWTIEVTLHLGLLEKLFLGGTPISRESDYLGLLLTDAQLAMAAGVLCAGGGWCVAALGRGSPGRESALLLAGALCTIVAAVGVELFWTHDLATEAVLVVGGAVGGAAWLALRVATRGSSNGWNFGRVLDFALLPALALALANRAAASAYAADWPRCFVNALTCLLVVTFVLVARRVRSVQPASRIGQLRWIPPGVALALAFYSTSGALPGRTERAATGAAGAPSLPDIVLIVLDTVRADHLRTYGYDRDTMPELERWASRAVTARRAVSAAGWTSPSHASLLSGLPVSLHGIHYSAVPGSLATRARPGVPWLTADLAAAGYYCVAVSANPLALPPELPGLARRISPTRQEWHESTIGTFFDSPIPYLRRLSERLRWRTPYVDAEQTVDLVTAVAPLKSRPVFLFVNLLDAHSPYNPPSVALEELDLAPEPLFDRYLTHRRLTQTLSSLPPRALEVLRDLYDGELRWIDMHLARLLGWIDAHYGAETVVIVTSDHGEELGEGGRIGHEYGLSQALLHVPLFVRSPGWAPGALNEVVSLRNLPKLMRRVAAGQEPRIEVLTRSDPYGTIAERYPSFFNVKALGRAYDRPWVALIEGELKGVGPSSEGFQLFRVDDLRSDSDVSDPGAGDALRLREKIDEYWSSHRDRRQQGQAEQPLDDEELDRLRALGYTE